MQAQSPLRFTPDIETIKKYELIYAVPANPVVFTGSSSVRRWNALERTFAGYNVLNRGVGGALINDITYHLQDLVFRYNPRQLVIYAGENDLGDKTANADSIFNRTVRLITTVRAKLPTIPVVYISIKPSPVREKVLKTAIQANKLIKNYLQSQTNIRFVDVFTPMLTSDGKLRPELFLPDMLHMNAKGYKIWTKIIEPYLMKPAKIIVPNTSLWDGQKLALAKKKIHKQEYKPAYNNLLKTAQQAYSMQYRTVMDKKKAPASGNKHDYMSLAIYFWPNPDTPDGLPYINKDGQRNPELKEYDAEPKTTMISGVTTLALAGYFSDSIKYSQRAVEILDAWFLNPATRMNPNLDYAQHVPGSSTGRCYGIIDTYNFVSLTDAITLLYASGAMSTAQFESLQQWFGDFTLWLRNSKNGQEEAQTRNNHVVAYDVQLTACALFSGKVDIALDCMKQFANRRIDVQLQPDGSQPEELSRTLAFHYSWYNLTHMIDMAAIAHKYKTDLINYKSADGRCILKALDFLLAYVGKQSEWKWKQIHDWDIVETQLTQELRKISSITGDKNYERRRKQLNRTEPTDITNLIFNLE